MKYFIFLWGRVKIEIFEQPPPPRVIKKSCSIFVGPCPTEFFYPVKYHFQTRPPSNLAAALTNPQSRPELVQSVSGSLPQTMHFIQQPAHTSNYPNSSAVQQHISAHPVQIRVQQLQQPPMSAPPMSSSQQFEQGQIQPGSSQTMFAVPLQRAPHPNQLKAANGPMAAAPPNMIPREIATTSKERYRQLKRKFKFLVYVRNIKIML